MRRALLSTAAVVLGLLLVGTAQARDHGYFGRDRGHYHYHPGHFDRHGNHYHYHPGHFDYHRGSDRSPGFGGYYGGRGYSSWGTDYHRGHGGSFGRRGYNFGRWRPNH